MHFGNKNVFFQQINIPCWWELFDVFGPIAKLTFCVNIIFFIPALKSFTKTRLEASQTSDSCFQWGLVELYHKPLLNFNHGCSQDRKVKVGYLLTTAAIMSQV